MPEYNVHHTGYVSNIETVEADSPEEAITASEVGSVSLCNQCSRDWDSGGDPEVFTVTDADGETVWEQAAAPQPVDRDALLDCVFQAAGSWDEPIGSAEAAEIADAVLALINERGN